METADMTTWKPHHNAKRRGKRAAHAKQFKENPYRGNPFPPSQERRNHVAWADGYLQEKRRRDMTNHWSITRARAPDTFARVAAIPKPPVAMTSENYFDALAQKASRAVRLNEISARAREEYPGDPDHDPSARFDPERD